ncbi:hypothetical protein IPM65_03140 [Candidatus Roizmanbacteria bacterium]|nr:MAG: hypothetical protein IPM65_03140 [Candidatus Roizmanbacteria bacterium]
MSTKRKPTSKQALYSSISSYADEVIQRLVELSKSKNENVALGACKTLLNKTLPDVKSVEVTQSNVLDSLISEELDRFKPVKTGSDTVLTMNEDEKQAYALELIELGQGLLGQGRYGKRKIRLAQNLGTQNLS